jgi:hypothetical protein
MSAKLSNCRPKSLVTLSNLAKNPSKKSKKIPKHTIQKAVTKSSFNKKVTATQPEAKLAMVKALGIYVLKFINSFLRKINFNKDIRR